MAVKRPNPDARRARSLYQLHIRPFLGDLSRQLGRRCTLADIPESMLEELEAHGVEALWLVGAWDRGEVSRTLVKADLSRMTALRHHVPDLRDQEVLGSPFVVRQFVASPAIGGDEALAMFRERLRARGLALVLDVALNHTARDCPWLSAHPGAYVHANPESPPDPSDAFTIPGPPRALIGHGRDPYFPGWPETAQLDSRSRLARSLMVETLLSVAERCDGIQCDMAMLGLADEFAMTWGAPHWLPPADPAEGELWATLIAAVREVYPGFWFIAEAYWGREWDLQEMGFSHTYDKTLYDRLRDGDAPSIRAHLQGALAYQIRCVRFVENHFQDRAAAAFRPGRHRAAAALVGGAPGIRMFVQGQMEGRRARLPLELGCHPPETRDEGLEVFYRRLCQAVAHPAVRQGQWRLLGEEMPAQAQDLTAIFVQRWHHAVHGTVLFVVNFSDQPACPRVPLDVLDCDDCPLTLTELMGGDDIHTSGRQALGEGVAIPLGPWGVGIYEVRRG